MYRIISAESQISEKKWLDLDGEKNKYQYMMYDDFKIPPVQHYVW